jgi:hypothetical protein
MFSVRQGRAHRAVRGCGAPRLIAYGDAPVDPCLRQRNRTFYFFLPDPNDGCQPAVVPLWLGAAAIILTFSFFGFFDSRLLLAMRTP